MLRKNVVKIVLDVAMAITFVLLMNPRVFNGLPFHEVAGLVIGVAIFVHIVLNYKWVVNTAKKMFARLLHRKMKWDFVLNTLLFLSMTTIIVTGIFISEVIFPYMGDEENRALRGLHDLASKITLVLVGVHIGLHWQWIKSVSKKLFQTKEGAWKKGALVAAGLLAVLFAGSMQWLSVHVKPDEKYMKPKFERQFGGEEAVRPFHEGQREGKFHGKDHHGNSHPLFVIFSHFIIWGVIIFFTSFFKRLRSRRKAREVGAS